MIIINILHTIDYLDFGNGNDIFFIKTESLD